MPASYPAPPARQVRAFTLVELTVVIVIIAVLAAIGAAAYNEYLDGAHAAAAQASAVSIRDAIDVAAAKADRSPAAEVSGLLGTGAPDTAKLLDDLGVSWDGKATYAAAEGGSPATLTLNGPHSSQSAVLSLPAALSTEVAIAYTAAAEGPDLAVVSDDFNRNDGPLGDTPDGRAWQVVGTPAIVSDRAQGTSGDVALLDVGSVDQTVQASVFSNDPMYSWVGLVFWATGANDYWYANAGHPGSFYLSHLVNGSVVWSQEYSGEYGTISVATSGSVVTMTDNGAQVATYAAPSAPSADATSVGFMMGGPGISGLDDFTAAGN